MRDMTGLSELLCCGCWLYFHVAVAAETHFDCVSVEYFVVFVVSWEILVDEFQEAGADLGDDVFVIWWIEPYYFPLSIVIGGIIWWVVGG